MNIAFPQDAARLHQLALNNLEITAEEFLITESAGHNPPPAVIALQAEMCAPLGSLSQFFHFAILPQGGFQNFQEDADLCLWLVEGDNQKIIKETQDYLAIEPRGYGVDRTSFTFPRTVLHRLLPVARRGWDLLIGEGQERGSLEQQFAYQQLRASTENFIQQFKYPSSLRDALFFALAFIPDTWADPLWPVMPGRVLAPTSVMYHGINMEVVEVFSNHMILLKNITGVLIFDLVPGHQFPSVVLAWGSKHGGFKKIGDIALWINKGPEDCIITGYATSTERTPAQMSIVRLISITGDIEEDWWTAEESIRKFGYQFRSVIFQHRRKTGQLEREDHNYSLRNQMGLISQERASGY